MIRRHPLLAAALLAAVACGSNSAHDTTGPSTAERRSAELDCETSATPTPAPDETTAPPSAPDERDVFIETPVGDTAATYLTVADAVGPVVVLIAGSGPTDRNGNTPLLPGPVDTLRFLAEELAARGISSIRFDKLGVGASAIPDDPTVITFDDFVIQAAAVRDWAQQSAPRGVALVGHSEGALIALELASDEPPVALGLLMPLGARYLTAVRSQLSSQPIDADLSAFDSLVEEIRSAGTIADMPADPVLASVFAPTTLAFLATADRRDPIELAQALDDTVPVLVACGTVDIQVPCRSLDGLRDAVEPAAFTDVRLDGVNHVLRMSGGAGGVETYTDPTLAHTHEVVDELAGLLIAR